MDTPKIGEESKKRLEATGPLYFLTNVYIGGQGVF